MRSNITGIDPDYDYLLDKQQDPRADHFPVCGCCNRLIYQGEHFWALMVRSSELIVCQDCKESMEQVECTAEEIRYGCA